MIHDATTPILKHNMTTSGCLGDTYAAALQHDIVEVPAEATLVGVVRRPTDGR